MIWENVVFRLASGKDIKKSVDSGNLMLTDAIMKEAESVSAEYGESLAVFVEIEGRMTEVCRINAGTKPVPQAIPETLPEQK